MIRNLDRVAALFRGLRKNSTDVYVRVFFVAFFITACTPTPVPTPTFIPATATATQTEFSPTATPTISPSATPTNTPTQIPTQTPIPCNPYETFCIEEGHFLLERPISPSFKNEIASGYRYGSTINGQREPHHGVEFENASGTPVLATGDGVVVFAGEDKPALYSPWEGFYGNLIVIEHRLPELDMPLYTLYAHLSVIGVEEGEKVEKGQEIGEVGWTGSAIGSHLHFEVRQGQGYTDTRNPELWLKPLAGGALVVRIENGGGKVVRVPLVVQRVEGAGGELGRQTSLEPYAPEAYPVGVDDRWQESHAMSDLSAGEYRISFSYAGGYWERYVEIHQNQVTVVYFGVEN